MILPHDTGHRVKDHIMTRSEVIDEDRAQAGELTRLATVRGRVPATRL
jgi:hypothetical protein